jgi:Ca2+-transporting ATPase
MKAPPRRSDQRLFDAAVMSRGLWQGAGLLLLLLAVDAGARAGLASQAGADDMARALTFVVLVLCNLGLIQTNRSWGRTAWQGRTESSRPFAAIAAATVLVLGVVLGVPAIRSLFSFALPPPLWWLGAVAVALVSVVWFEAVKRWQTGAKERRPRPR